MTAPLTSAPARKSGPSLLKKIAAVFVLLLSAALQYTAMREVSLFGVRPNLLIVATVATGFAFGGEAGGLAGFCLGLYQDAQSGKILGMYALFYMYAGAAAGFVSKKNRGVPLPAELLVMYLITLANETLTYLFAYAIPVLRAGLAPGVGLLRAAASMIVPAAFLNTLMCVPYYILFRNRR